MDYLSACKIGDINCVKKHLKIVQVDDKDFYGNTGLALCVRNGHKNIAKVLIEAGAEVNTKNCTRQTPLIIACHRGNLDCVELLLKHKAKVNIQDNYGRTALMCAVSRNYYEISRILLEYGADTALEDTNGKMPLDRTKNLEMITLLQKSSNKKYKRSQSQGPRCYFSVFSYVNDEEFKKTKLGRNVSAKSAAKVNELKNSLNSKNEDFIKAQISEQMTQAREEINNYIQKWLKIHTLDIYDKMKIVLEKASQEKLPKINLNNLIEKTYAESKDLFDNTHLKMMKMDIRKNTRNLVQKHLFKAKQDIIGSIGNSLKKTWDEINYEVSYFTYQINSMNKNV